MKHGKKTDQLIEALTVSPETGKQLLSAAIETFKKDQSVKVVNEVRAIMERKALMERTIDKAQKRLELCIGQLQAINDGKFTLAVYDHPYTRNPELPIKYQDESLNVGWSQTEQW